MSDYTVTVEETDDGVFSASCTCSWTGEDWESHDDAQIEGDDHRDDKHWRWGE